MLGTEVLDGKFVRCFVWRVGGVCVLGFVFFYVFCAGGSCCRGLWFFTIDSVETLVGTASSRIKTPQIWLQTLTD